MKNALFLICLHLSLPTAFAQSRETDLFSVGTVGRVCIKSDCQRYSQVSHLRVELKENSNRPGHWSGEAVFEYEIEGIKLSSVVQVSDFYFNDNHQINLYLKTSEVGSSQDLGSSEVIVSKMSKLNQVAQYSVPIVKGDLKIEPVILVGPSIFGVRRMARNIHFQ